MWGEGHEGETRVGFVRGARGELPGDTGGGHDWPTVSSAGLAPAGETLGQGQGHPGDMHRGQGEHPGVLGKDPGQGGPGG